ncbi:hypothetical protein D3C84_673020 [compost metagenome]
MTVAHLTAFTEQGVGLVEQQDRAAAFGRGEYPRQVFLGLADVLADQRRQIDAVEVQPQFIGQHFGGQGLAGAAAAGEQGADTQATVAACGKAPVAIHPGALADLGRQCTQAGQGRVRQYQIVPAGAGVHPFRQVLQAASSFFATHLPEVIGTAFGPGLETLGETQDGAAAELKLFRQQTETAIDVGD